MMNEFGEGGHGARGDPETDPLVLCRMKHPSSPSPYDPKQCAWAMSQLLRRLAIEGYVHCERIPELLERATNLERGRGFLTDAELEKQASIPTPTEEELLS